MGCKVLFYDCSENEEKYLENNKPENFEIKLFTQSLNKKTVKELSTSDLEQTSALNIYTPSILSKDVINMFKNLRVIVIRSENIRNIDLKTCLERNIAVVSIPSVNEHRATIQSFKAITGVLCGCKENRIV